MGPPEAWGDALATGCLGLAPAWTACSCLQSQTSLHPGVHAWTRAKHHPGPQMRPQAPMASPAAPDPLLVVQGGHWLTVPAEAR